MQQYIPLERRSEQLENELEEAKEACNCFKSKLHQQKNELLMWVDTWQQMRMKKNIYKRMNKLLITYNDELMKCDKYREERILKLKAKLSEARRMAHMGQSL